MDEEVYDLGGRNNKKKGTFLNVQVHVSLHYPNAICQNVSSFDLLTLLQLRLLDFPK